MLIRLFVLVIMVLVPALCIAEETVECSAECPAGKVMVSYTDGDTVTCVCYEQGTMDETVPTETVQEEAN